MRSEVFRHFRSGSHPGIKAGIRHIGCLVVWYDMRRDVTRWTRECQQCARSKIGRCNTASLETVTPPSRNRFTHVQVDLTGPLCPSKEHNYIMAVVDRYSRFFQAITLVDITAEKCADAIVRHWITIFDCKEHIYCDRGAQFTSSVWCEISQYLGCQVHHFTVYHLQAQGTVERLNRILETSLKCHENPSEWYDQLPRLRT